MNVVLGIRLHLSNNKNERMKHFILAVFVLTVISCSNSNMQEDASAASTDTTNTDSLVAASAQPAPSCYQYVNDRDTVLLSISGEAITVTGLLSYNYYQKDKSSGGIQGNMFGDTLIADYTFQSEGATSIREVAFLKKDSSFAEGYGDVEEKDGKMVFKNRNTIQFTGKPLKKTECK